MVAWPIPVSAIGSVAAGIRLWRFGGALNATVVVKATFELVDGSDMRLAEPEPIVTVGQNEQGGLASGWRRAAEIAPLMNGADLLLTGTVDAGEATLRKLRFAVAGEGVLLDKTLEVHGEHVDGGKRPIGRLLLSYLHAYGGIGFDDNPLGVGHDPAEGVPRIIDPAAPNRPGGFGPIPDTFPARKKKLGDLPLGGVRQPLLELPAPFDFSFFNAAPRGQRVARVRGNEWITVEGFAAEGSSLRSRLPDVVAVARVYGSAAIGAPDQVPLMIDRIHVDYDMGRCLVLARGSFPVMNEDALSDVRIAGALAPIRWPAKIDALLGGADTGGEPEDLGGTFIMADGAALRQRVKETPFERTVAMGPNDAAPPSRSPFPLARGHARPEQSDIPGAPWSRADSEPPIPTPITGDETVPAGTIDVAKVMQEAKNEQLAEEERAEREREREAAGQARREAEERRAEERRRFLAEQEEAKRRAEQQAEAERAREAEAAQRRNKGIYGGFKRRR